MPFPRGYALTDAEMEEVVQVIRLQAAQDGRDGTDPREFVALLQEGFGIVSDAALRRQYIDNASRQEVTDAVTAAQAELTRAQDDERNLPPDPGPVPPRAGAAPLDIGGGR